jgi:hypothetical protein
MLKHSFCSIAFGSLRAVRDDTVLDFNPNLADIKRRFNILCGKRECLLMHRMTLHMSLVRELAEHLLDAFLILPKNCIE